MEPIKKNKVISQVETRDAFWSKIDEGAHCFIDLDEVLCTSMETWLKYYSHPWSHLDGFPANIDEWDSFHKYKEFEGYADDIFQDIINPKLYYKANIPNGGFSFLNHLSKEIGFDRISILTSTYSKESAAGKVWFCENKLGIPESKIIHSSEKYKHYHGNILIDDGYHNLEKSIGDPNTFGILVNRPWNKNELFPNRVNSLDQLI